jgi:threonine/homoserine/homoserine lactone efflux protein
VLVHTVAATVGLAALLRTVPAAYLAVKAVGAAYLALLGIRTLRADGPAFGADRSEPTERAAGDEGESRSDGSGEPRATDEGGTGHGTVGSDGGAGGTAGGRTASGIGAGAYRRGVAVNALNPKVALFFLAFLPAFAGSGPGVEGRMLVLGLLYALLTAGYLALVGVAADRARGLLRTDRARRGTRLAAGGTLLGFAAWLALDGG